MTIFDPAYRRTLDDAQARLDKLRRLYDGLNEILRETEIHRFDYVSYREVCRDLAVREIEAARLVAALLEPLEKAEQR